MSQVVTTTPLTGRVAGVTAAQRVDQELGRADLITTSSIAATRIPEKFSVYSSG